MFVLELIFTGIGIFMVFGVNVLGLVAIKECFTKNKYYSVIMLLVLVAFLDTGVYNYIVERVV